MSTIASNIWKGIKQNPASFIWLLSIVWTIGSVLDWSHLPLEYRGSELCLTFNSMISHMIHGGFDVDPAVVGSEGFLRNGKVYAYWGIFPALLRLPFFIFPNALHLDITRFSIISSSLLILFFNYKLWSFVSNRFLGKTSWLSLSLAGALAFSGEQVCFFRPSIYQEVCLWALTFSSCFVYCAIRTLFEEKNDHYGLVYMAIAATGALLTRVSMGIGLYCALLCFLVYFIFYRNNISIGRKGRIFPVLLSFVISILGLLVTGYVNYKRWGNPLTFANYYLYIGNAYYPSRILRTRTYGLFNIKRFFLGIIYFFFPIWTVSVSSGKYFIQEKFTRLIDSIELPPSSFFVTDSFMLFLTGFIGFQILRGKVTFRRKRIMIICVASALAVPACLMLTAISMNYRYRAEFYPDIIFLGVLACIYIQKHIHMSLYLRKITIYLLIISILSSNIVCLLYKESDFGPAYFLINNGIGHYYKNKFFNFFPKNT